MKTQPTNVSMMNLMQKRFRDLCQRSCHPHSVFNTDLLCQNVLQFYGLPERHYHNLGHLSHCLAQFDQVRQLVPHPDTVEMALWFHDVIYLPGSDENELKSSQFFMGHAQAYFPDDFILTVQRLILVTTHKVVPQDEDEFFMVDIDLSSFGLDWDSFLLDSENIRKERQDMTDRLFFQAHNQFLASLLARKRIFQTQAFYRRYEHIAHQNIHRLLAMRQLTGKDEC